jgi:membrane protease YdiL (CAAX protease family)
MALEFRCKECGHAIVVKYLKPGEQAKCRNCGAENIIPMDAAETNKEPEYHNRPPVYDEKPPVKKQSVIVDVDVPAAPSKPFPGFSQTLLLFLIYMAAISILVFNIVIIGTIIRYPMHKDPVIMYFIVSTAMIITMYFGYTQVKEPFKKVFSLRAFRWLPLIMICVVLLGLRGCFAGIGSITFKLIPEYRNLDKILMEDLVGIYTQGIVWSFLFIVIIAPVIEELFFRGLLLRGYLKRYSTAGAIIITALLFGIMHGQYVLMIWGFIIGLILAWLYILTRSVWACIIAHSFTNITALIFYYGLRDPTMSNNASIDQNVLAELIVIAIGVMMCTAGILMLIKISREKEGHQPFDASPFDVTQNR